MMNTQGYYTKKAKYYDLINAHKLKEAEEEPHNLQHTR